MLVEFALLHYSCKKIDIVGNWKFCGIFFFLVLNVFLQWWRSLLLIIIYRKNIMSFKKYPNLKQYYILCTYLLLFSKYLELNHITYYTCCLVRDVHFPLNIWTHLCLLTTKTLHFVNDNISQLSLILTQQNISQLKTDYTEEY